MNIYTKGYFDYEMFIIELKARKMLLIESNDRQLSFDYQLNFVYNQFFRSIICDKNKKSLLLFHSIVQLTFQYNTIETRESIYFFSAPLYNGNLAIWADEIWN